MMFGYNKKYNIIFDQNKYPVQLMNLLYNATDGCALISSNEGWGLSLTEAMMAGKPIIATVTGGMQDQMAFRDDKGNLIQFTEEFGSNHRRKYEKHGVWAYPVFPSNISIVGSVPTPYIFDDRAMPEDIAEQIRVMYLAKTEVPDMFNVLGERARGWVTSDESMQSSRWMSKNIIDGVEETLTKFKPRQLFDLIKLESPKNPKHYVENIISK